MASGSFVHEKTGEPMLDPALLLWTGVLLQALVDSRSVPGVNRSQARAFLRGQTSFTTRAGRRMRSLDMILGAIGIDPELYYALHLLALEREWASGEARMAEVAAARHARTLRRQRTLRANRSAATTRPAAQAAL